MKPAKERVRPALQDSALPAKQTEVERLAVEYDVPKEEVEKLLDPWSDKGKTKAHSWLKDEEHALALDPALTTKLRERIGGAGVGVALHLQMDELGPQDEIERMIVLQLKAMHGLTLRATRGAHVTGRIDQYRDYTTAANKSSRTFATLLEALNRHRGKSSEQKVTVEHVHVHEGGQAIVGHVEAAGGRGGSSGKKDGSTP